MQRLEINKIEAQLIAVLKEQTKWQVLRMICEKQLRELEQTKKRIENEIQCTLGLDAAQEAIEKSLTTPPEVLVPTVAGRLTFNEEMYDDE